jgi:deazaflavin-dependent oxidoreductase (nitroreductase family)
VIGNGFERVMTMSANTYIKPGFFTTNVFNPAVAFLARRLGLSMKGARVLSVQGRKTGEWHSTPVNPLSFSGQRYLVAPRGETQWVRNIRVSGEARLVLGRRTETVRVEEIADREKPEILRAYLKEWAWEVNQFFGGIGPDASADALARIAPKHPVFRILPK